MKFALGKSRKIVLFVTIPILLVLLSLAVWYSLPKAQAVIDQQEPDNNQVSSPRVSAQELLNKLKSQQPVSAPALNENMINPDETAEEWTKESVNLSSGDNKNSVIMHILPYHSFKKDGDKYTAYIEFVNEKVNSAWMSIQIALIVDEEQVVIAESGYIKPGEYIKNISSTLDLPQGEFKAVFLISVFDSETFENKRVMSINGKVKIE